MLGILAGIFIFVIAPLILILLGAAILLGLGWVITLVLPLSLFEASLLVGVVGVPILWVYYRLVLLAMGFGDLDDLDEDDLDDDDFDDDDFDDDEPFEIYVTRRVEDTSASRKRRRRKGGAGKKG